MSHFEGNSLHSVRPDATAGHSDSPRRLRLCLLSWLVLAVMSACMVVIIVPGLPGSSIEYEKRLVHNLQGFPSYWSDYDFIPVQVWTHGWPVEYLRRPFVQSTYLIDNNGVPVVWSSVAAWPQGGKVYAYSLLGLAVDLLIGAAIVAVMVAACEYWRRRRGGYRVSMLDVGVLATILCMMFGWRQYHLRTGERERAIIENVEGLEVGHAVWQGWVGKAVNYCGPDWLQRLVGNAAYLPEFEHVTALAFDLRKHSAQEAYDKLGSFKYVTVVECHGKLTDKLAKSLATLSCLETLHEYAGGYGGGGGSRAEPMLTSANVGLLRRLPQLTTLKAVRFEIAPEDLEILATLPNLQVLHCNCRNLLIEDLSPLDRFPALKTVQLNISATNEELQEFQANHSRYQLVWDEERCLDPWTAMHSRLARWRGEVDLPPSDLHFIDRDDLDFSGILLTKKRLKRLPQNLSEVEWVTFGTVDSPDTAIELLNRCGPIRYLDARHVAFSKRDFERIEFKPDDLVDLYLQQGAMSAADYCWFAKELKPNWLCIFASTFSREDAEAIEVAGANWLGVYRGMQDDENDLIYPVSSNDDPVFSF